MTICSLLVNCTIERKHARTGALLKKIKLQSCELQIVNREYNCSYNDGIRRLNIKKKNSGSNYHAIQIPLTKSTVEIEFNSDSLQLYPKMYKEGKSTLVFKTFHYQILIYDAQPKQLKRFIVTIQKIMKYQSENRMKNEISKNTNRMKNLNLKLNHNHIAKHNSKKKTKIKSNKINIAHHQPNRPVRILSNSDLMSNRNDISNTIQNRLPALRKSVSDYNSRHDDDNQSVCSHSSEMSMYSKKSLRNGITPRTRKRVRRGLVRSRANLTQLRTQNFRQNKHNEEVQELEHLQQLQGEMSNCDGEPQFKKRRVIGRTRSNKIFKTPVKEKAMRKQRLAEARFVQDIKKYKPPENFSDGQRKVMRAIINGDNVFITGGAGTGKSYLIHEIIRTFPAHTTFSTACTGIASSQIQGITIYSFCGIGSGNADKSVQLKRVLKNQAAVARIRKAKLVIIDEVSMLSGQILDKINFVLSHVRKKKDKPFGGIQMVFCGDFYQLPPVFKEQKGEKSKFYVDNKLFAFESKIWLEMQSNKTLNIIVLQQIFRQQNDSKFQSILNEVRIGEVSKDSLKILRSRIQAKFDESNGIRATILLTHKKRVLQLNERELKKLKTKETMSYSARDSVNEQQIKDSQYQQQFETMCPAPSRLQLKIGAQVILIKNMNVTQGLCNGSRGVVVSFSTGNKLPVVKFSNGCQITVGPQKWNVKIESANGSTVNLTRKQIPLNLGWALSIHKSQGMSLDCVKMSLSSVFEFGQCYVALSRATTLEGLSIIDSFDVNKIKAHPKVKQFYGSVC